MDGELIDLEAFPGAKNYFESNSEVLKGRHVSKKQPVNWFRTIDKVRADLLARPKLLLPDLASAGKRVFFDNGRFYPHHNLYFISGGSVHELEMLGAILISNFVVSQMQALSINMNGGIPRYQAQSLKKLYVPLLGLFDPADSLELCQAFKAQNVPQVDGILQRYFDANGLVMPKFQSSIAC